MTELTEAQDRTEALGTAKQADHLNSYQDFVQQLAERLGCRYDEIVPTLNPEERAALAALVHDLDRQESDPGEALAQVFMYLDDECDIPSDEAQDWATKIIDAVWTDEDDSVQVLYVPGTTEGALRIHEWLKQVGLL